MISSSKKKIRKFPLIFVSLCNPSSFFFLSLSVHTQGVDERVDFIKLSNHVPLKPIFDSK